MITPLTNDRTRSAIELAIVFVLAEIWLWSNAFTVLYRTIAGLVIAFIVLRNAVLLPSRARDASQSLWDARTSWIAAITVTFVLAAGAALSTQLFCTEGEQWRLGRLERILEPRVLADKAFIVILQQVLVCRFIFPMFQKCVGSRKVAFAATAVAFGLLHLPSLLLAAMAAFIAVVWLLLFERSQRLTPLMASHFFLAVTAATIFPERLTYNLAVGRNALPIARSYERLTEGALAGEYREWKSTAYYEKSGNSDRAFIIALYHDILRRRATEPEIDAWLPTLRRSSRAEAVARFMDSKEFLKLRCALEGACG
jgi:membrane protease YdiL (CAAX protease family)